MLYSNGAEAKGSPLPITTERLPRSLVALTIEVEPDRLEASMGKAVRRVSEQVKIPGFRPGKAPRAVVERTVGRPALIREALDQLLPDLYSEAIESEGIDAIGQPEFELESMEPVVVHAKVPVRPRVDLKDYLSLRAPRPEAEATPDQVEDSLMALRRRFATLEPVDRAVQWGDAVRADVTVNIEGQDEHEERDTEFRVEQDAVVSLPGFLEKLIGLERGGSYDISLELPDDFEAADLAGKTASYQVRLHEIKQEVLPELDEEFVRSLDEDEIDTVEALRERVEHDAQEHVQAESLAAYQDEVVDLLLATGDLEYPEVLVEREIDRMLDQESNHASHTPEELAQWLERIGKTEQEVRDTLGEAADLSVRRALVLGEFMEREEVDVSEESVDEELDSLVEQMVAGVDDEDQRQQVRALFDTAEGRESIRDRLSTRIAVERLVEICSQPEEEAAERPRRSRRRRGSREAGAEEHSESADSVDSVESRDQASETQQAEADGDSGGATGDDGDENEEQGA